VSQSGTPAEKAEVRAKVHARYPGIGQDHPAVKQLAGALTRK